MELDLGVRKNQQTRKRHIILNRKKGTNKMVEKTQNAIFPVTNETMFGINDKTFKSKEHYTKRDATELNAMREEDANGKYC